MFRAFQGKLALYANGINDKTTMTEKKDKRYRVMHRFWLDITKDDEDALDEQIAELKQSRKWQTTARNALRLFFDLRAGRVDVLLELFPFVEKRIAAKSGDNDSDELKQIKSLLLQMQLEQQGGGLVAAARENTGGPKPLGGLKSIAGADQNFDLPTFDDDDLDDLVVVKESKGDGQSSHNFLRAMTALQNT